MSTANDAEKENPPVPRSVSDVSMTSQSKHPVDPARSKSLGSSIIRMRGGETSTFWSRREPRSIGLSIVLYLLRLMRDVIAYLIRGGLSTLMFFIDFILSFVLFILEPLMFFPGGAIIISTVRFLTWCFQMSMWVVYTIIELFFYLPAPVLLVYVLVLCSVYMSLPAVVDNVLSLMLWVAHFFLHVLKALAESWA